MSSADPESTTFHSTTSEDRVAPLRGPAVVNVGRTPWLVAGALGLLALSAIVVVSFLSAVNDHARLHRLQSAGIDVSIKVLNCTGNIGGSGSNSAGYTCRGSYRVDHVAFNELIGDKTTLSPAGATLSGVVDPAKHSTVVLASAIKNAHASLVNFVTPLVLALLVVVLARALWRVTRRRP